MRVPALAPAPALDDPGTGVPFLGTEELSKTEAAEEGTAVGGPALSIISSYESQPHLGRGRSECNNNNMALFRSEKLQQLYGNS